MIKVIDNFLPKEDHARIKESMIGNSFPWFYINSVTYNENPNEKEYYFIHHFLYQDMRKSTEYPLIEPLMNQLKVKKMLRAKGNLYPNVNEEVENLNHIDYNYPHFGAVYSVNSNNGGTIFSIEKEKDLLVSSVENRIVIFDGLIYHRSKYCTDEKVRVNINLNFL